MPPYPEYSKGLFQHGFACEPECPEKYKRELLSLLRIFTTGGGRTPPQFVLPDRPQVGVLPNLANFPTYIHPTPDGEKMQLLFGYIFN